MSYVASRIVLDGLKTVVAMEQNVTMPAVEDIVKELDLLALQLAQSEQFYDVPFRNKQKEFNVAEDVKAFFEEYYFGEGTRSQHLYRPRALYRLVIEPLLDDMAKLTHGQVLDYGLNIVEQLKEQAFVYRAMNKMDYKEAYAQYQKLANAHLNEKKISTAVKGIMKLRTKSIALFKQLGRNKATA